MEYTIKNIRYLLNNKQITITELTKMMYKDLSKYNYLNAFVTKTTDIALKKAKFLDSNKLENSLFFGMPYVAKDLFITKNILTTACSNILRNFIPPYDATIISILNNKNAILIGKSTTDELGMGGLGINANNGIVFNPWNKEYIAGGSSSGSAALVGSGIIPFALATDTGDSIRKPASYCGIVGFKPTYGVISRVGVIPYSPSFDTVGYFVRNVEDCALAFQELLEYDVNDFSMKKHKYDSKTLNKNIKNYKVAYIKEIYDNLNPELKIHFDNLFIKLKEQGITVKLISFDIDLLSSLGAAYYTISCVEAISSQSCLNGICFGEKVDSKNWESSIIETRTKNLGKIIQFRYIIGQYCSSLDNQDKLFIRAKKIRRLIYDRMNLIFDKFDILIGPSVNSETKKIKNLEPHIVNFQNDFVEDFLLLSNFAGTPSLTLPFGFWKKANMPFGINVNSQRFNEKDLFNFSLVLENIIGLKNLNPKNNTKGKTNE